MAKGFIRSVEKTEYDELGNPKNITTQKEFAYNKDEDKFYMVFVDFVKWMYELDSITAIKLLNFLLENAEFNTGKVSLTAGLRQQLIAQLKVSTSALTKALKILVAKEILKPIKIVNQETGEVKELKGEYIIAPEMFWKGDLKTRKKLIVTFKAEYDSDFENEESQ